MAAVLSGEGTADLGRGLTLGSQRVAGAKRPEPEGVAPDALLSLKATGCLTDIIAHQLRVFVSMGARRAQSSSGYGLGTHLRRSCEMVGIAVRQEGHLS